MKLRMKELRVACGLEQKEIAMKAGMNVRRYGSYERGERTLSLEDACAIADILECTLDELAGRDFPSSHQPSEIDALYNRMDDDSRSALLTMARNSAAMSGVRERSRGRVAEGAVSEGAR